MRRFSLIGVATFGQDDPGHGGQQKRTLDQQTPATMRQRKIIEPNEPIDFALTRQERDVVLERTFLDTDLEKRLRLAVVSGSRLIVNLTLDDADELAGFVAAEAITAPTRRYARCFTGYSTDSHNLKRSTLTRIPSKKPRQPGFCWDRRGSPRSRDSTLPSSTTTQRSTELRRRKLIWPGIFACLHQPCTR